MGTLSPNSGRPKHPEVVAQLYHCLLSVLEREDFNVGGVRFGTPRLELPVLTEEGVRMVDLAIPLAESDRPLLIVEVESRKNVTSPSAVRKALRLAIHSGAPLFAVTNGRDFAMFKRASGGRYSLVLREDGVAVSEGFAEGLLATIARLYREDPGVLTVMRENLARRLDRRLRELLGREFGERGVTDIGAELATILGSLPPDSVAYPISYDFEARSGLYAVLNPGRRVTWVLRSGGGSIRYEARALNAAITKLVVCKDPSTGTERYRVTLEGPDLGEPLEIGPASVGEIAERVESAALSSSRRYLRKALEAVIKAMVALGRAGESPAC